MIPEGCPTNTKGSIKVTEVAKTDQKQLGQLIKSIFGQLSSGNPVKMIVDIKNPEVMIGNESDVDELNTDGHMGKMEATKDDKIGSLAAVYRGKEPSCCKK